MLHVLTSAAIAAHVGAVVGPGDLLSVWEWEPVVLAGLVVSGAWYFIGVCAVWRRAGAGSGIAYWRAVCFAAGLLALFVALVSPLAVLGETLFSAHMVQHLTLMLVAAPLIVAGAPLLAALWALPRRWRRGLGRWWRRSPRARAAMTLLTAPLLVWLLQLAAMWVWHAPGVYQAALRSEWVHALEHASLLGAGLLFWWLVFQPVGRRRLGYAATLVFIATTLMQSGALGALLSFAQRPWYPAHAAGAAAWHLTPLADQQLAGVIMWVPMDIIYLAAAAVVFMRWLDAEQRSSEASKPRAERQRARVLEFPLHRTAGPWRDQ
jgi:putative membrane protein